MSDEQQDQVQAEPPGDDELHDEGREYLQGPPAHPTEGDEPEGEPEAET
jgi:hypothetical protein